MCVALSLPPKKWCERKEVPRKRERKCNPKQIRKLQKQTFFQNKMVQ